MNQSDDSESSISSLTTSDVVQSFIITAQLDFGLEYESSYVVAAAHQNGFLKDTYTYTKELRTVLNYPEDDVGATLRLLALRQELSDMRFQNFTDRFGIDVNKMNVAHDIANVLILPNKRFTHGIRPISFSTRIEAISNLFTQHFIFNPCVYINDSNNGRFLDYEKDIRFDISSRSRLYTSPGFRHTRAAVYYHLKGMECREIYVATFLCLVPVRMTTMLKYSKIYNDHFPVGSVVARRILNNAHFFNRDSSDPAYISVRSFDHEHSALNVLYTNNSREIMIQIIQSKIYEVAAELSYTDHRHYMIDLHKVNAIVGPGLQVLDIVMNNQDTDALSFESTLNNRFTVEQLRNLYSIVKKVNKHVSFVVFCEDETFSENLIAIFPTITEASNAFRVILNLNFSGFIVKPYNVLSGHSFLKAPKESSHSPAPVPGTSCVICYDFPASGSVFYLHLCGHVYCVNCFAKTVEHAKRFPITCAVMNCIGVLTFADFDKAFSQKPFASEAEVHEYFSDVMLKSFNYFMRSSQNGYTKCMDTGCHGILDVPRLLRDYKVPIQPQNDHLTDAQKRILSGKAVECVRCGKARCGMCGYDFHYGFDCQEFYARNFVYNDSQLAEWKKANPNTRRFCPNNECHILIEKSEGCNHMQCTACQIHFCWLCKDFQTPDSRGIYEHMTKAHGGNGLQLNDFLPGWQ